MDATRRRPGGSGWFALLLLALLAPSARAGGPDGAAEAVDRVVRRLKVGPDVGVVVGVITPEGRRVVGYGPVGPGRCGPAGGRTLFEIGSITKVFTALLLADMAEEGLVRLDDPVQLYLPEGVTVPRRGPREITLEDLATHTSGLPRLPPRFFLDLLVRNRQGLANPYAHMEPPLIYRELSGTELARDVGAGYEYSNFGAGLLGHALSRRAGKSYEDLIVARIAAPLGMADTRIALSSGQAARLATGHDGRGEAGPWDFAALAGCGALRSTADDLLTFVAANLGVSPVPARLRRALDASYRPRAETGDAGHRVALGWHLSAIPGRGRAFLGHNGGTGGYRSFLGFEPAAHVGVVLLAATAELDGQLDRAGVELLRALVPEGLSRPGR